eukprot:2983896-Rhodomonas_salina.4
MRCPVLTRRLRCYQARWDSEQYLPSLELYTYRSPSILHNRFALSRTDQCLGLMHWAFQVWKLTSTRHSHAMWVIAAWIDTGQLH